MPLGSDLQKILSKTYEPKATIDKAFRGNDLTFISDENGDPHIIIYW